MWASPYVLTAVFLWAYIQILIVFHGLSPLVLSSFIWAVSLSYILASSWFLLHRRSLKYAQHQVPDKGTTDGVGEMERTEPEVAQRPRNDVVFPFAEIPRVACIYQPEYGAIALSHTHPDDVDEFFRAFHFSSRMGGIGRLIVWECMVATTVPAVLGACAASVAFDSDLAFVFVMVLHAIIVGGCDYAILKAAAVAAAATDDKLKEGPLPSKIFTSWFTSELILQGAALRVLCEVR